MKNLRRYLFACLLTVALLQLAWTPRQSYVESNYTKHEYRIPMRDGKKLFTAIYSPKNASHRYPILLNRTPYSIAPYGVGSYPADLGPSEVFSRDGFIFVYQDVRGRMMSEGEFVNMTPVIDDKGGPRDVDEASDAYDTIDWLIKNIPNNNGNVGIWGISYPGFFAACSAINAHPALKAISPQGPIADWFIGDDFHHNGALYLAHAFGFLSGFGRPRPKPTMKPDEYFKFPTPDGYDFYLRLGPLSNINSNYFNNEIPFWNDITRHGVYDAFWKSRNLRPHLKNVKPAVMTVGGWYDAEDLFGTLGVYESIESSSPGAYNILVMGPWFHGGWARAEGDSLGNIRFGSSTAEFYRKEIEFPFFRNFLKGEGNPNLPEAYVFLTGANEWRKESQWPPANAKAQNLYLQGGGKLSWELPLEDSPDGFDEYVSDPQKPVPYIDKISIVMTREHMVEDQRFASRRTDVLTYQTDALKKDIAIAGPIIPDLNVSTTGTDSDFVVKLIDVYPDGAPDIESNPANVHMGGYQQLVRGELFRGKFRNSFSDPDPFTPGQIANIHYRMPDVFHEFRKGHRIMVQIQSSWFPLVDRNPQQFVDIYRAKEDDFKKATERIYRSKSAPSFITVYRLR
jgi:uncharacterized protein